jgi:DNA helicase-2/ATP-dependent DNA helicase PcrA
LLILAGPGSGKTRVITERIAHLLRQGMDSRHILALTFTNKASAEMWQRLAVLVPGHSVWISTFHRFCARLLREHAALVGLRENFTIYDDADSLKVLKEVMDQEHLDLVHFTPERIAQHIGWAKNNLTRADQYVARPGSPWGALVAQVYPAYQRRLRSLNAVDFDDLLLDIATLLRENPELREELDRRYRHILVDEYQDTNLAQYVIVRALSIDFPNLAVTGDPDQSIYAWRGADINNILNFEKDFPRVHVVRLEQNYRSTRQIVEVAAELISHNRRRVQKRLYTDKGGGLPVRLVTYADQEEEARDIAAQIASAVRLGQRRPRDFGIFFRVNALSRAVEHALADHGLPYQIVNGLEFYQSKEVKDVLAYLGLLANPRDDVALLRILNVPPRGIGTRTVERLREYAQCHQLAILDAARSAQLDASLPKRAAAQLARFVEMIDRLRGRTGPVHELVRLLLSQSGYYDALVDSELPEDRERLDNLQELLTAAGQYDKQPGGDGGLEGFLEQVALVNDTDRWDAEGDRITLMSLHAAKGLEFPVVYIAAVEEGLLPHERSRTEPDDVEEERRLFFVGITRAREELQLSFAKRRAFRGTDKPTICSQFLLELPRQAMQLVDRSHTSPMSPTSHMSASDSPVQRAAQIPLDSPPASGKRSGTCGSLQPGTLVKHPAYGLGKILAISGSGRRQTATVEFFALPERKTFRLDHSPLESIGAAR